MEQERLKRGGELEKEESTVTSVGCCKDIGYAHSHIYLSFYTGKRTHTKTI